MADNATDDVPHWAQCPVTHAIMRDPVIATDGHTYERAAIARVLADGVRRSPMTNLPLASATLLPNRCVRDAIADWRARTGRPESPLAADNAADDAADDASDNVADNVAGTTTDLATNVTINTLLGLVIRDAIAQGAASSNVPTTVDHELEDTGPLTEAEDLELLRRARAMRADKARRHSGERKIRTEKHRFSWKKSRPQTKKRNS